jgi:protein AaeX
MASGLPQSLFQRDVVMIPMREIDVLGIFVTPAWICLLVALPSWLGLRRMLDSTGIDRFVWNRALVDLSILIATTSLLVLSLRFEGP